MAKPKVEKIVLTTTLYRLRKYDACQDRYYHLVSKLGPNWGDKDPINLLDILKHNGIFDCLWAFCAVVKHPGGERVMHLMAADFAEAVLPIYEKEYPNDNRPRKAIEAARQYANGETSEEQRDAASSAAKSAACDAVLASAWTASDVAWAAKSAARATVRDAAWSAREAAMYSAKASQAKASQAKIIRKYLGR